MVGYEIICEEIGPGIFEVRCSLCRGFVRAAPFGQEQAAKIAEIHAEDHAGGRIGRRG